MVLSDQEIWEELQKKRIVIKPFPLRNFDDFTKRVVGHTADLLLDRELILLKPNTNISITPVDVNKTIADLGKPKNLKAGQSYELKPNEFVIGHTKEIITLPDDIAGRVEGRSSLARLGLVVHMTAPTIHPGYNSNITLEICNFGPYKIKLESGMRIAQIIFERLGKSAKNVYKGFAQTRIKTVR